MKSDAQPLTEFQEAMRQWKALTPYNAGHVMRISGAPDLDRWRKAVSESLRELGYATQTEFPIEISSLHLNEKITNELNTGFAEQEPPLRAFILAENAESHLFGIFFDHWFADSASIRALLHRIWVNYSGTGGPLPPLRLATRLTSAARRAPQQHLAAILSCARNYLRHRHAYRIPLRDPLDFATGFFSLRFPAGAIERIRTLAKGQGATVNDAFLAAAAQVFAEFSAGERRSLRTRFGRVRRDRIGIATAADLRPPGENMESVFGFFLGYFTVVLEQPEKLSFNKLTACIARETSTHKNSTRALEFVWNLRFARWMWNRLDHARSRALLFHKALPLVAGISNVNLTGSWVEQVAPVNDRAAVLDYFRVSPTGPLLPLVFTLTTIADRLSLSVTYRTTAFSAASSGQIASAFVARLIGAK